jgi:glycosyltransferase involved in cell wall biosynthesis
LTSFRLIELQHFITAYDTSRIPNAVNQFVPASWGMEHLLSGVCLRQHSPSSRPKVRQTLEYALTTNSLSTGFRHRFEDAVGLRPAYMDYSELRVLSPVALLRTLRGLSASRLFLPFEETSSRSILPLMKGLAALTGAPVINVVGPDLRIEAVTRWNVGQSLIKMVVASAVAARDMARCEADVKRLLRLPRPVVKAVDGNRVLYIKGNLSFGFQAGGSIGHVAGVVNALAASRRQVTVASTEPLGMLRTEARQLLLKVPAIFGLPFEKSYYSLQRLMAEQLEQEADSAKSGFIYQRMAPANYVGVHLSHLWNVPLVLEYNGSEIWVSRNWGRRFRYPELAVAAEEVCLRHAHLIVAVSEVLADQLVERGVERERIVWYPNGVDPTMFDPARFSPADRLALRDGLGIAANDVVLTFIGTFGQWHGVEVFAQAIRHLVDHHGSWCDASRVRFMLVGDGPKMPVVRRLLGIAPYAPRVTLTGLVPQSEAASYLAISDVVVSPHVKNEDGSRFFGSPTKLFEYMAMGKAIVASDLEQIGTILKAGIHADRLPRDEPEGGESQPAVLCEPGNVAALSEALRFMVDRPVWRTLLGANARKEVLAKYTWPHHVAAILDGVAAISPMKCRHE